MPTVPSLRVIRQSRMLSQAELAEQADTTQHTVSRLEQGRPGRYATIRRLAEALDVTPAELRGDAHARRPVFDVSKR